MGKKSLFSNPPEADEIPIELTLFDLPILRSNSGYEILTIPPFDRQLKRLAKKCRSLKQGLSDFLDGIQKHPEQGTQLGNNCRKVRIAIRSKGKGKSGGARMITYFVIAEKVIYLLSIYDKADKATITDEELKELLQFIEE